jgi:lysyl-tRNA synthetase class 2
VQKEVPVLFAATALGEPEVGDARAVLLGFTVGLLLTFLAVRANTRLIRAQVSWWFHDITPGGTHIHHMVFGVIIMVTTGLFTFGFTPTGLPLQILAFVFGAGVALTLDEFALILHLEDVYWSEQGRISVDAIVVATGAAALTLIVGPPLVGTGIGRTTLIEVAVGAIINLSFAFVAILKGKLWTGFVGIWVPFVAVIGGLRLARPNSPWARARYARRPKKLARAEAREAHRRGRPGRFRDWFYDLIAGKPSLPPLGAPKQEPKDGDD